MTIRKLSVLGAFLLSLNFADAANYKICAWPDDKKSAVSFTFDDGCKNQYTVIVPVFDKYDYKGTFFTITSWVDNGNAISWTNLKKMAANGHEIASHTVTHPHASDMASTELTLSKKKIEQRIGVPCVTIAYPYCEYPSDENVLKKNYISGRICSGAIMPYNTTDYYEISSIACGSAGTVNSASDFTSKMNEAADQKGWLVFLIHEIDGGSGYSPTKSADIDAALEYAQKFPDKFWVDTYGNVARYVRERGSSRFAVQKENADTIALNLYNSLDTTIYNYPLTIRYVKPEGWADAKVTQDSVKVESWLSDDSTYIYFYALPNAGIIEITEAETPTAIGSVNEDNAFKVTVTGTQILVDESLKVISARLLDMDGKVVATSRRGNKIGIAGVKRGAYVLNVTTPDGLSLTHKVYLR